MFDALAHQTGRNRQVVHAAAGDAELLVERIEPRFQLFVSAHVVEAALDEEQPAREVRPRGLVDGLAGEARDTALGSRTDVLVRIRVAGAFRRYAERNDREMRRQ